MKLLSLAFALLCLLGLNACKPDKDSSDPSPTTVLGRWQLTQLECYCAPGQPTPDEAVEFDAGGNFTFYKNGQVEARGTYQFTTGAFCGNNSGTPLLSTTAVFSSYTSGMAYTIEPTRLVLDQGLCMDLPRKTYQRTQ